MAKTGKHGLGRGLDALLGGMPQEDAAPSDTARAGDVVLPLSLARIDPNRGQPRRHFDEEALRELADSILSVGVVQPILVRQSGDRYTIIAGERRWRAARLAGLEEIPAIVRDWDDAKRLEVALIENLQRDDLNPVEQAVGVKKLMERCKYTQEAAAERLGISRPAIANLLRLLTLPESVLQMLIDGRLSAGHARALVSLKDQQTQQKTAALAVAQGWSVRQLERICAEQAEKKETPKPKDPPRDPELSELERMARDVFGTKAQIEGDSAKGRLVLHYYDPDDLQRIWEILEFMRQSGG